MPFHSTIRGSRYTFADLGQLPAKANEEKSGDVPAGIAAASQRERVAGKRTLADVRLSEIVAQPLIDLKRDEVSRPTSRTGSESPWNILPKMLS